jgi:hypothetical protein
VRFSLQQFTAVFELRNAVGKPYVIIGGQAVNYWAETYLEKEPGLAQWLPFTSKDIDFQGDRRDVLRIAKDLGGWEPWNDCSSWLSQAVGRRPSARWEWTGRRRCR